MLRLAVDRKFHTKNKLIFEVTNKGNKHGLRLEMINDGLKLYHRSFASAVIQKIPKLPKEIRKY